jgi:multiple sugar transport system substrate-binding protein
MVLSGLRLNQIKVFRVGIVLVGFFAFLVLPGCFQKGAIEEYMPNGKLKIVFWHAMGGPLGDTLGRLIAEYNRSQKNYHVHTEFMGRYDILEQKVIASVMASKTPDLAQMYEGVTMLLTRDKGEESLQPMNQLMADWDGFSDLFEAFQRNSTYENGQVYSLPFNKSFPVLMYNQEILELLGRSAPPATWDELRDVGRLVHEKIVYDSKSGSPVLRTGPRDSRKPVMGYAFAIDPWLFEIMLLQNGGAMTNPDQTKVAFDSEMAVESLAWFARAIQEGWAYRTEGYNHQNDFGAKKVAFIVTSCVSQLFMRDKLNFNYGVRPVLGGTKRDVSIMSGTNVSIFSGIGEKRSKGAWDFIRWFNSPEITARWARETFYVPTRKQALNLPEMQVYLRTVKGGNAAASQLKVSEMEPRSSAWYRCRIILRAHMEKTISWVEKASKGEDLKAKISHILKEATFQMNKELKKYQL